jgi:hypothetical protein
LKGLEVKISIARAKEAELQAQHTKTKADLDKDKLAADAAQQDFNQAEAKYNDALIELQRVQVDSPGFMGGDAGWALSHARRLDRAESDKRGKEAIKSSKKSVYDSTSSTYDAVKVEWDQQVKDIASQTTALQAFQVELSNTQARIADLNAHGTKLTDLQVRKA